MELGNAFSLRNCCSSCKATKKYYTHINVLHIDQIIKFDNQGVDESEGNKISPLCKKKQQKNKNFLAALLVEATD